MKRILVVNDSRFESIIMKDILTQLGYIVKISDEYHVLQDIAEFSPECLVVNYIMKETRGDYLIYRIKSRNPHIKCVLSSSNTLEASIFEECKADVFLKTPADKATIRQVFRRMDIIL